MIPSGEKLEMRAARSRHSSTTDSSTSGHGNLGCKLKTYDAHEAGKTKVTLVTKLLVAFVKKRGALEPHGDVPNNIRKELYLKERQRLESQQSKNKIGGSWGSSLSMNININGMPPSSQTLVSSSTAIPEMLPLAQAQVQDGLKILGLQDVAVKQYTVWHEANVEDDALKAQFRQAHDVAWANGLDLKLIHGDQNPSSFIDKEILSDSVPPTEASLVIA
ncbi:hypothetical protein PENDEC_c007G06829 [Penicillium decumbens]|uniref:Uncharacterized protein n=1 Tax=Penicillium decumbens TaxID=69771 RepID=A0A1V6PFW6_PENDC|nr:hypothetical protein PENDEC_c007G06829 [Penicillium decumbens]